MRAPGTLYVVATPIGNRADLSERARQILASVEVIAAEDTRHTGQLLRQLRVHTPLLSLHAHNEKARTEAVLARLKAGADVALVSDAGTPLIADPGYPLVAAAHAAAIKVVAVPGPCAAIAALSVSGLPADRFCFEGFLPAAPGPRRTRLAALAEEPRTLIFYEAPHRLKSTLADLAEIFGSRPCALARELTKLHETIYRGTLASLAERATQDADLVRGELVLVVDGAASKATEDSQPLTRLLTALLEELPLSRAVDVAVRATGAKRNDVYRLALGLKPDAP